MKDLSTSAQALLSQAIVQLNKTASASDIAKQGVEILVKHLSGNVLSLQKNSGLLTKTALINQPEVQGKLAHGETFQVKLAINPETPALSKLDFFSASSQITSARIAINNQQLQTLLNLPASQLVVKNEHGKIAKLPSLQATVLPLSGLTESKPTRENQPTQKTYHNEIQKQQALPQQNFLRLTVANQHPPVEIQLPIKQLSPFTQGDKVTIELIPKNVNWQVKITSVAADDNLTRANVLLPNSPKNHASSAISHAVNPESIQRVPSPTPKTDVNYQKTQQTLITPQLASSVVKLSLQSTTQTPAVSTELSTKAIVAMLDKLPLAQSQQLSQKIQDNQVEKVTLQIKPSGEATLLAEKRLPIANIPISKDIAQALAPLKLPNHQALQTVFNLEQKLSTIPAQQLQNITTEKASSTLPNALTNPITTSRVDQQPIANKTNLTHSFLDANSKNPIQNDAKPSNLKESLVEWIKQPNTVLRDVLPANSIITPALLANKPAQLDLIQSILRVVQAKAESPAIALNTIEKAVADPTFFKDVIDKPTKQLIEQAFQQIKQTLPQGKEQDASQIRQLLAAPALNLSSVQMVSPSANQGMLAGLVTLLQMSLSARLMRNQSYRTDNIVSSLNNVLSNKTATASPINSAKSLGDLSQLEQKHQLLREISRLLAGHQANKLNSAEQLLQGQESLYYNLPSALGGSIKNVELLIKREQESEQNNDDETSATKTWHLTMKLAVGGIGELLTKAKLRPDNLEVNFYASNEEVKLQVMNYLPLFRKKLQSLGIEVAKSQCQLGKMPDTLQMRPHQAFQAKA